MSCASDSIAAVRGSASLPSVLTGYSQSKIEAEAGNITLPCCRTETKQDSFTTQTTMPALDVGTKNLGKPLRVDITPGLTPSLNLSLCSKQNNISPTKSTQVISPNKPDISLGIKATIPAVTQGNGIETISPPGSPSNDLCIVEEHSQSQSHSEITKTADELAKVSSTTQADCGNVPTPRPKPARHNKRRRSKSTCIYT